MICRSTFTHVTSLQETGVINCVNSIEQTDSSGFLVISSTRKSDKSSLRIHDIGESFKPLKTFQMVTCPIMEVKPFKLPRSEEFPANGVVAAVMG